ncbi:MAG: hypothetical protein J0I93_14100 [Legionella sp.]|nr:hypothetical protein [Legionella sp.]
MFENLDNHKQRRLNDFMCSGDYQNSFFKPFTSFSDAKKNVKAIAALPLINLGLALNLTLEALMTSTFGVANIVIGAETFDLDEIKCGGTNITLGAMSFLCALYYGASMILDTLDTFIRLVTHSLATIGLGLSKTAIAIAECCNPSAEPELNF